MDCRLARHIAKGEIVYGRPSLTHHFYLTPWDEDRYHDVTKWCEESLKGKWHCFPEMVALNVVTSSEAMIHINCIDDSDAMLIKLSF